jgi:hypothetical protein
MSDNRYYVKRSLPLRERTITTALGCDTEAGQRRTLDGTAWGRAGKACNYVLTLWDKLTRFLEYQNWSCVDLAENSMRPVSSWSKELDPYREHADTRAPGLSSYGSFLPPKRIAPIFGPACFSWESRQTDWNILPARGLSG